jgi:hypothetical protein
LRRGASSTARSAVVAVKRCRPQYCAPENDAGVQYGRLAIAGGSRRGTADEGTQPEPAIVPFPLDGGKG